MNCKHYFWRTVKDADGIPYGYEQGCMAGHDCTQCNEQCKGYEPTDVIDSVVLADGASAAYTMPQMLDAPHSKGHGTPKIQPKDYAKKKKAKRRQQKQSRWKK